MSGIVRPNNTGQSGIVANVETIDSDDYVDGSIDNAHLADDAVDSDELAAGAVDTAHIADNQVTLAKMAGITRGSIIIGNASGDPAALGIGSNTYVLTSDATDISWAAAGSGPSQAVQSDIEDETNQDTYIPPDLVKYSPGVAKFWVKYDGASAARNAYYNVGSVTDGGTGDHTVNITTDFSSAHWCATMATRNAGTGSDIRVETMAAGTLRVLSGNGSGAADSTYECIAGFGTQV
jgi:hypothetical protein